MSSRSINLRLYGHGHNGPNGPGGQWTKCYVHGVQLSRAFVDEGLCPLGPVGPVGP